MHRVDAVTDQMIRSVLAYAENRLRLDPVPLDGGPRDPADLQAALKGLLGDDPHSADQILGVYASVMAPAVISADSPRFLGFIPAAPTKASLLFDMLVSCASIQGISWLEAAGAIHAENQVLRLIADRAGLPESAGGCFVSGGSAANLSALVVAREVAKRNAGSAAAGRRWRVAIGADAHSSIVNTLRILEMDPLVVHADGHRVTGAALRAAVEDAGGAVALEAPLRLDAVALMQQTRPDVLIIAPSISGRREPALMPRITAACDCPAVLFTRDTGSVVVKQANRAGVLGFMLKPLRAAEVAPTLDLALARFRDIRRMQQARAERPIVDQAKGKLMTDRHLSEAEAFRWLRKQAMDSRQRLGDVARAVLAEEWSWDPLPQGAR